MFRTQGKRWATPLERAELNFARQIGEDFIKLNHVVARCQRTIGESGWLE